VGKGIGFQTVTGHHTFAAVVASVKRINILRWHKVEQAYHKQLLLALSLVVIFHLVLQLS